MAQFPTRFGTRIPDALRTGLLDKFLHAVGSVLRRQGQALDSLGSAIQGPYGLKAQLPPNAAWLPFLASSGVKGAGKLSEALGAGNTKLSIVTPAKAPGVFVAPSATVLGNVTLGAGSSIWYGATLRGDVNSITVGERTNIQDNAVVHVAKHSLGNAPRAAVIGSNVTIGHGALVHAATIGDGCLVGMGATLLDGVTLEPGAVVAAGAVVPPGSVVKSGEIWAGAPAKLLRKVSADEAQFLVQSAENYASLARDHLVENGKAYEEVALDDAVWDERAWRWGTDIDEHMGILRDPQTQAIISMR